MKISELNPKHLPIVYCDMDGVLVDLFNAVAEIHDVEHYNHMSADQWEKFFKTSDAYHLFRDLPAFASANALIRMIKEYAGDYCILSSPLSFDKEGSIKGKREWLNANIVDKPDHLIFDHDKYKYAVQVDGTPNILIDDYGVNTRAWSKAGGIAIKYQADESDLDTVETVLKKVFANK